MTLGQIMEKHREERNVLREKIRADKQDECVELRKRLDELNLSYLVRRKDTGKIGTLSIEFDGWLRIAFYPLTKKGEVSKRKEYYYCKNSEIESFFEPYEEEQ